MFKKQRYLDILHEYRITKKALKEDNNQYLLGKLMGLEYCVSRFGYSFVFDNGDWYIKRTH